MIFHEVSRASCTNALERLPQCLCSGTARPLIGQSCRQTRFSRNTLSPSRFYLFFLLFLRNHFPRTALSFHPIASLSAPLYRVQYFSAHQGNDFSKIIKK